MPQKSDGYYTDFYPGVDEAIAELKQGNVAFVEPVISFLEKDPYSFGSGYRKEKAWRYLRRVLLTKRQKERLCDVAIACVKTRMGREFFPMCRFVCGIMNDKFCQEIYKLSRLSDDGNIKRRATLLAAYFQGVENGERYRLQAFWHWVRYRVQSKPK